MKIQALRFARLAFFGIMAGGIALLRRQTWLLPFVPRRMMLPVSKCRSARSAKAAALRYSAAQVIWDNRTLSRGWWPEAGGRRWCEPM